jgi:hypothetical protein
MRVVTALSMLLVLAGLPASAQAPALGKLEVKAYQKIPKTKIAVQLSYDTAMGRELRRAVMEQIAHRGNEVGFSGGNVMRLDFNYLDLLGGGNDSNSATIGGQPSYAPPGSNPRPEMPNNRISRDLFDVPKSSATLRITLTLYTVDTGKVIWAATTSCGTDGNNVQRTGERMIDAIFKDADHSRVADADCSL